MSELPLVLPQLLGELPPFEDRFLVDTDKSVDVIIPVLNTVLLWEKNLLNYYARIPIRRLFVGDAGCTDDTIKIACKFPRLTVLDQTKHKTLGFCLRELIEQVQTEWFIYLHSDVFLPEGWFEAMCSEQGNYDWFECNRRKTVILDLADEAQNTATRSYSGSQMGRRKIFDKVLPQIEDDFLYRNEDMVLQDMVEHAGGKYGRTSKTHHHHQLMDRAGAQEPDIATFEVVREVVPDWIRNMMDLQIRGVIKYTKPSSEKTYLTNLVKTVYQVLRREHNWLGPHEFCDWVEETNPAWLLTVKRIVGLA